MTRSSAIAALCALERDRYHHAASTGRDAQHIVTGCDVAIRELIAECAFPREWFAVPRGRSLVVSP